MNEQIRVRQVRLIGADGEQVGIVDTRDALKRAREEDLDLVLVGEAAQPPVAKLLDYGRYRRFADFLAEQGLIDPPPPVDSYVIVTR